MSRRRVLILCTHNSARSQMAEGLLRAMADDRFEVASAGTEATRVHPLALRVMDERGVDLRGHASKTLDRFLHEPWDYVITVCDNAKENCPFFPSNAKKFHHNFSDPAKAVGTDEEVMAAFRSVRDSIKEFSNDFVNRHL